MKKTVQQIQKRRRFTTDLKKQIEKAHREYEIYKEKIKNRIHTRWHSL